MSTKIIQAINAMVDNKHKINVVGVTNGLLWFNYDKKYNWSISEGSDGYFLTYYPGSIGIPKLMELWANGELHDYEEKITYSSEEIKTKEAQDSFKALYLVVNEKRFNIDNVLDDIINDLPF